MAWTAPRTWVTGETVTAALMNAHVRDNLLETAAATVTTAGDLAYADAANSMGSRLAIGSVPAVLATTGSAPAWRTIGQSVGDATYTSATGPGGAPEVFTDFDQSGWGTGTNVAVTVTTGTRALVFLGANASRHATAGAVVQVSYRVSGATTTAASTTWAAANESGNAGDLIHAGRAHMATLTAGSNTFTLQGIVSNNAAAAIVNRPYIIVMGL